MTTCSATSEDKVVKIDYVFVFNEVKVALDKPQ